MEAREHTAQVDKDLRLNREWRFRYTKKDRADLAADVEAGHDARRLPVLMCSPTMELGVDISALDVVFLRNVPPTPANYTQRAGRAGRAGQAALVTTYCAAQSPHDRYHFNDPAQMVAGVVRPPMLDLLNEDMVRAHCHAVWLAESGVALAPSVAEVLDVAHEGGRHPVRDEVERALRAPDLAPRAARRIVATLRLVAGGECFDDAYAQGVAAEAFERFDAAFEGWRRRLRAAEEQRDRAYATASSPGASKDERRAADAAYHGARRQIDLLKGGQDSALSDFFTYRYLATEGFLPGYNFPRLPLTAFVPGSDRRAKGDYLSRARFLAIAEFGPMSLIYQEGQAYRVVKATLPPEARGADGSSLATDTLRLCPACGAIQASGAPERCEGCEAVLGDLIEIREAFRVENVETAPTERISANDEERQRQGFEIQTAFAWARDERLVRAEAYDDGRIAALTYGPAARIVRINKGLRRRREKGVLGFRISVQTGRWAGGADVPEEDADPLKEPTTRVVPVVEDRKNAILLIPDVVLEPEAIATLQSALARGIERHFHVEEGEIAVEAVPDRDARRGLLIYEAVEGGAGVLSQMVSSGGDHFRRVAELALETMHYVREEDGAWQPRADAPCIAGCYRCLLSYYNQPDHELIDRKHPDVATFLGRLTQCEIVASDDAAGGRDRTTASREPSDPWCTAALGWGLPLPDAEPFERGGHRTHAIWRDAFAAIAEDADLAAHLEGQGFLVLSLPSQPPGVRPPELARALGVQELAQ